MLSLTVDVKDIRVGDVIEHPHGFSGEVTRVHSTVVDDIPEGGTVSGWMSTKQGPNRVQGWTYRFGKTLTVGRGEECVYGHSGSMVAACDLDAVVLRGDYPYCKSHADWYDWCEANQLDVGETI